MVGCPHRTARRAAPGDEITEGRVRRWFIWLTKHFPEEQRFFEDELGAHLELRLGRWARAYWPAPPRQRELCVADIFELTARKQTAYACLIRAYRSVRLLESGEAANTFRFADLFRYVAEEGQRQSPWLSFDEAAVNEALATRGEADAQDEDELAEAVASASRPRRRGASGPSMAATNGARSRPKTASATAPRLGAAQRVRANQRAFYQAFAAFERYRLLRRIGADDRQRPDEPLHARRTAAGRAGPGCVASGSSTGTATRTPPSTSSATCWPSSAKTAPASR